MGRPAEAWAPSDGPGSRSDQPDGIDARVPLGDPDSDPYVVEGDPARGLGQVGVGGADEVGSRGETSDAGADTGPLVRSGKEAAA